MTEEISFRTFLFSMGVNAMPTGLYLAVSGKGGKRAAGIAIALLGALCALLTIKGVVTTLPDVRLETWLGIALTLITWSALAYDILKVKASAVTAAKLAEKNYALYLHTNRETERLRVRSEI
jgi:hypothetical protein